MQKARPRHVVPLPASPASRGIDLWIKRDDCTGLAFGGNKVLQLEFHFGEARARGADTVLVTGAVQSNLVRIAAAAARKPGAADGGSAASRRIQFRNARSSGRCREAAVVMRQQRSGASSWRSKSGTRIRRSSSMAMPGWAALNEASLGSSHFSATASTETMRTRRGVERCCSETPWTSARIRCTSLR